MLIGCCFVWNISGLAACRAAGECGCSVQQTGGTAGVNRRYEGQCQGVRRAGLPTVTLWYQPLLLLPPHRSGTLSTDRLVHRFLSVVFSNPTFDVAHRVLITITTFLLQPSNPPNPKPPNLQSPSKGFTPDLIEQLVFSILNYVELDADRWCRLVSWAILSENCKKEYFVKKQFKKSKIPILIAAGSEV